MKHSRQLMLGLVLSVASIAQAELSLPDVISDHMMLQADRQASVWGWGDPGETVTVTIRGQSKCGTVDNQGCWRITLSPMPASSEPCELVVQVEGGNEVLRIKDVLIGDVWLAGGQSNMSWPVNNCLNAKSEKASANQPELRIFMAERVIHEKAPKATKGAWVVCHPKTVGHASAVGYFFVRTMMQKTGRPQALLNVNWGGTPIESWVSHGLLESDPVFATSLARTWKQPHWVPSSCHRSMLAPLFPYTLRGILWYQGEGNRGRSDQYRTLFPAMIREWRSGFGKLPFYYVQLATEGDEPVWFQPKSKWAELCEAQMLALSMPQTGMVVTHDLGIAGNVHYPNKKPVGQRLARIALEDLYGMDKNARSPVFDKVEFKNGRAVVSFRYAEQGLAAQGEITGFVVAGSGREFLPAKARLIDGNKVEVWNEAIEDPQAVRYAWSGYPIANLRDSAGLPVSGFRTDAPK